MGSYSNGFSVFRSNVLSRCLRKSLTAWRHPSQAHTCAYFSCALSFMVLLPLESWNWSAMVPQILARWYGGTVAK
jgi:hypothetical protein